MGPETDERPRSARWTRPAWIGACLALIAAGTYWRVRDVGELILLSDEVHAVSAARAHTLIECFTFHSAADNSVPYTLYARVLLELGWLHELPLRLPALAAGLLLMLAPLLFLRRLGPGATLIAVALFASSPILTYFSFVARPYSLALLCTLLAFCTWERWLAGGGRRARLAFAVCAGVAPFLHVFAALPMAGLFAASLLAVRRRRVGRHELLQAAAVAVLVAGVLVGPGVPSLLAAHADKLGGGSVSASQLREVLPLLTGFLGAGDWLIVLALLVGLAAWWRAEPIVGLGAAASWAALLLGLAVLQPSGNTMDHSRYLLLAWPLALLCVSAGLAGLIGLVAGALPGPHARHWREPAAAALGLFLAAYVWTSSPVRLFTREVDSFRTHRMSQAREQRGAALPLPVAYTNLLRLTRPGEALLETPVASSIDRWSPYSEYQRRHARRVILAEHAELPATAVYHGFCNVISLADREQVARSGARYLVLHADLPGEYRAYGQEHLLSAAMQEHLVLAAAGARALAQQAFGEPLYADAGFEVYDLVRNRP